MTPSTERWIRDLLCYVLLAIVFVGAMWASSIPYIWAFKTLKTIESTVTEIKVLIEDNLM